MGAIVLNLLKELNIETKLLSIIGDNASNNETLVDAVENGPAQQLPQAVLLPPSPSFSFLALAGEIRPQPSLIPACQSVCPCLA